MAWTIYWYILKDLARLLVLSSLVLAVVISFAVAIKPLSDGDLDPLLLVKFIIYVMPTLLTLVLPFAGAFAGTMVFNRMASDNEIMVCSVGGMSYRSILVPVLGLGLVLFLILYYMSNWVVPWFFHQSQLIVQKDVTTMLVRQVKAGRPVEIPGGDGRVLFADNASVSELAMDTPQGQVAPYQRITLIGVSLGRFDVENKLRELSTAQQADLYLFRQEQQTWAQLNFRNATVEDEKGNFHSYKKIEMQPMVLPNPFSDDLRYLSWSELIKLADQPHRYDDVARRKLRLEMAMARQRLLDNTVSQLDTNRGIGKVVFLSGSDIRYEISAPQVRQGPTALTLIGDDTAAVIVSCYTKGLQEFTYESSLAELKVELFDFPSEPEVELELYNPQVRDIRRDLPPTAKKTKSFKRLRWASPLRKPLSAYKPQLLLAEVDNNFSQSALVVARAKALAQNIRKVHRKISAYFYERCALAVTSLLVMLLGAVLSMKLRGAMPLTVYFWTFLLATVCVFITRSGVNVASDPQFSLVGSILVLWLGNLVLLAAVFVVYVKLSKN